MNATEQFIFMLVVGLLSILTWVLQVKFGKYKDMNKKFMGLVSILGFGVYVILAWVMFKLQSGS